MLRPIYHLVSSIYEFDQNDHIHPWYRQSLPFPVIENNNAKILWDTEIMVDPKPIDNANKPDIVIFDKKRKECILIEGTICTIGEIENRTLLKQNKYTELRYGISKTYDVTRVGQINIVLDFIGGYHKNLIKDLQTLKEDPKSIHEVLQSC